MSTEINPDSFNLDIPILARMQPYQDLHNRDACNMDIPILNRFAFRFQSLSLKQSKTKDSTSAWPATPAYWTTEMEQDSECRKRLEVEGKADDDWVITMARGKFAGRVDLDEMTA
jgi:hypothetical protein